jgi:hypothetical protein
MKREALIKTTVEKIKRLPDQKLKEISDFADFLLRKIDDQILTDGIMQLAAKSKSYDFLNDDDDLYTVEDLKEVYK